MPHVILPKTGEAKDALVPVLSPIVCVCVRDCMTQTRNGSAGRH